MALDRSTAICYAAVLDDAINKLGILGKALPYQLNVDTDACQVISREINHVIRNAKDTEAKLVAVLQSRAEQNKEKLQVKQLKNEINMSLRGIEQTSNTSPLSKENYEKLQLDRGFVETTLFKTQMGLLEKNDWTPLNDVLQKEKQEKFKQQQAIVNEEAGKNRINSLKNDIEKVKKEHEEEVENCNELIAHLKDQLQEMKAKSNMEGKYVKKRAELVVAMNARKCQVSEDGINNELGNLDCLSEKEAKVNSATELYLNNQQVLLEEKLEFWIKKYETDTKAKQHELDTLKASRSRDLEKTEELLLLFDEYEKFIVHDRIEQERINKKARLEMDELNSATLLQCWWRTKLVERKWGPFRAGKKKGKKKKKKNN